MSQASKFLSLLLRHEPERIGIALDAQGWTDIDALLAALRSHGVELTRAELDQIVETSDKQRFAISSDGRCIRANQGHSVPVDLGLVPERPPDVLYHGTVAAALPGIRAKGLLKGQRHHVHLSADITTAKKVGGRRGAPIVLAIKAAEMAEAGHGFLRSTNGVWLVEHVPVAFIELDDLAPPPDLVPSGGGAVRRAEKAQIARDSLAACEAGFYTNTSGARVELAALIDVAKRGTRMYEAGRQPLEPPRRRHTTTIEVTSESTLEALVRLAPRGGHLACLSFASARRPGGGFLGGAQAQEESLARASALYPCLSTQPDYYARNKALGSAIYLDLVLYSPGVPFFRDDDGGWLAAPVLASVITAAAPNVTALEEARRHDPDHVAIALRTRAELVLAVAAHHGVDRLVLGAWGAGVFGNDPRLVARLFAELLRTGHAGAFAEVVFAVLGTRETSPNHRAFAEAFA